MLVVILFCSGVYASMIGVIALILHGLDQELDRDIEQQSQRKGAQSGDHS